MPDSSTVALAPSPDLALAGPRRVLSLVTTQDPHNLTQPPTSPWPISYSPWLAPGNAATSADPIRCPQVLRI